MEPVSRSVTYAPLLTGEERWHGIQSIIENALESMEDIADNVEEVNRSIQDISVATDDQAASTEGSSA